MNKLVIDTDKLIKNIELIKSHSRSKIIAVLKANAYGLGLLEFANILQQNGIDFFAVADIRDGLKLRENGISAQILLLTPTCQLEEAQLIAKNEIIATVGSMTSARVLNDAASSLNVTANFHLKIDTGFGRFGFLPREIPDVCSFIKTLDNIQITGTYSHFSFSFSSKARTVHKQYNTFMTAIDLMQQNGLEPGLRHICNSSAFLLFPEMHLDAVRIGSAFLGRILVNNTLGLEKIGYLKSRIIESRELPKNHNIGYANTYRTKKPTRIGIVPVGYVDGFGLGKKRDSFRLRDILSYIWKDVRLLKKKGVVVINGRPARILGRININNIVVDLTNIDVGVGDEVILNNINPLLVGNHVEREYIGRVNRQCKYFCVN